MFNPISLASQVLKYSTKPLSLRRVPPNLLVGRGATDFASEIGMPVLPSDALISAGAYLRFQKWTSDLKKTARQEAAAGQKQDQYTQSKSHKLPGRSDVIVEDHASEPIESSPVELAQCWNDSQPPQTLRPTVDAELDGPTLAKGNRLLGQTPSEESSHMDTSPQDWCYPFGDRHVEISPTVNPAHLEEHESNSIAPMTDSEDDRSCIDDDLPSEFDAYRHPKSRGDLSLSPAGKEEQARLAEEAAFASTSSSINSISREEFESETGQYATMPDYGVLSSGATPNTFLDDDIVNDTVGAIAVDAVGNIAAGSSSGGIGMKHVGRIGPAALVGVGTSVIPIEPDDEDKTSVATVTSGTGEHMATTMASTICANRIYTSSRRTQWGGIESTDDSDAIKCFVERDFMAHPSVKNSSSTGAIGILCVRKTKDGIWLHFAHNTDSFAIASMSSEDEKPKCLMSRNTGHGDCMTGGRSLSYRPKSTSNRITTWPINPEPGLDPCPNAKRTKRIPKRGPYSSDEARVTQVPNEETQPERTESESRRHRAMKILRNRKSVVANGGDMGHTSPAHGDEANDGNDEVTMDVGTQTPAATITLA